MTAILTPEDWLERRTLSPEVHEARQLSGRLRHAELTADTVLLARDCATTLGRHLLSLRHGWPGGESPFGQVLVADLGSSDATIEIAREAAAPVILPASPRAASLSPAASGSGLVQALTASKADLLLLFPARLARIDLDAAAALLAAFTRFPSIQMAIGFQGTAGADLSRLLARPLISVLLPELSVLADPACPMLAIRRSSFLHVPIAGTSGYEPSLAVETWRQGGLDAICQVRIPKLEWGDGSESLDEDAGFRCSLALLESLRRARRLNTPHELGHLASSLTDSPTGGLRAQTRLETFPWTNQAP